MSLTDYTARYLPRIEDEMKDLLELEGALAGYYGMMQYHLGWIDGQMAPMQGAQGKRLRPVLCLLACEAAGGRIEQALPAAAAIELVHNFSLIHDDIEDGSATRRHRATVWKLWGQPQAINVGDGMYTAAYVKLSQLPERGVPLQRAMTALRTLSETCLTLTEGQYLDMTFEDEPTVGLEDYLWMIRCKSAALIACATQLGALLGGAQPEVIAAYRQFGDYLGMAFQVIDDILGIWGSEDETGKSTSSDILARKKTLPIAYALSDPVLQALYAQESIEAGDVSLVIEALERCGARAYAERMAEEYSAQALYHLEKAGLDTPAHRAMGQLARSLLGRTS
ncbi:MAG TPA: polyprenyl synthetase family protein [Anaerolineae bacterium]|nr:polyprenyl synthetase family protein [Anaerolineae bacterium]